MHCFGSFLLQAMFLNLQVFAFKEQNMKFTVRMLFTCIRYIVTPGPAVITTVCKYNTSRLLSRISYLSSYVNGLRLFKASMCRKHFLHRRVDSRSKSGVLFNSRQTLSLNSLFLRDLQVFWPLSLKSKPHKKH